MVVVHIRKEVGTRVPKSYLLKNILKKFQGFFFQFCDSAHWQSSTRGIDQIWLQVSEKRKVYKFKNHTISQRHFGTYCLNMAAREYFPLKSGEVNLASFLFRKNLFMSHTGFLLCRHLQKCPKLIQVRNRDGVYC
jgi:hypothetical protein